MLKLIRIICIVKFGSALLCGSDLCEIRLDSIHSFSLCVCVCQCACAYWNISNLWWSPNFTFAPDILPKWIFFKGKCGEKFFRFLLCSRCCCCWRKIGRMKEHESGMGRSGAVRERLKQETISHWHMLPKFNEQNNSTWLHFVWWKCCRKYKHIHRLRIYTECVSYTQIYIPCNKEECPISICAIKYEK